MAIFLRGDVYWYEFCRRIRESSKTGSKTLARAAEQRRKRELEEGFNNFTDTRHEKVRTIADTADDYLESYRLYHPQSSTFASYAVRHVKRLIGTKMVVDCNEQLVTSYQNERLSEGAAPKTINDEVGFLLRVMDHRGDLLRFRLKKRKLPKTEGWEAGRKAYTDAAKERMLAEAKKARSPHIYPAIMLALNTYVAIALKQNRSNKGSPESKGRAFRVGLEAEEIMQKIAERLNFPVAGPFVKDRVHAGNAF